MTPHLALIHGSWGLNSVPHAYKTSALPADLLSQPQPWLLDSGYQVCGESESGSAIFPPEQGRDERGGGAKIWRNSQRFQGGALLGATSTFETHEHQDVIRARIIRWCVCDHLQPGR